MIISKKKGLLLQCQRIKIKLKYKLKTYLYITIYLIYISKINPSKKFFYFNWLILLGNNWFILGNIGRKLNSCANFFGIVKTNTLPRSLSKIHLVQALL